MEFFKDDYILGIWFAEKKNYCNFVMTVVRRCDQWLGEYRFRYFAGSSQKVFESDDVKSFYKFSLKATLSEEEIIRDCNLSMDESKKRDLFDFYEYVEVKGDFEKFKFRIAQEPWCHIKTVRKEDLGKDNEKV